MTVGGELAKPGDAIIVTGDIGRHGCTILLEREDFGIDADVTSDCAPLWKTVKAVMDTTHNLHVIRDATRGSSRKQSCMRSHALTKSWRTKYNCLRPHEALGNKCPADVYTHSERIFADKVEPFEYEPGFKVIKVNSWGYVRFQNFQLYLSETFINDYVQFRPNPNNDSFLVCYRNFVIAEYDSSSGK